MPLISEGKYHEKLERLGQQLFQTENLLQTHPLVNEKLQVLQTIVRFFCLQTDWSVAGPLSRLSMTLETAFQGDRQSLSGFIGPTLHQMQQGLAAALQTLFNSSEKKWVKLIVQFTQLMTLCLTYLSTQTLGNWKRLFPTDDPGTIKQSGLLLRELGLTFILGTSILETPYKLLAQELALSEKKQNILTHLGLSYLLLILILVNEEDEPLNEDLIELISKKLQTALPSLEELFQENSSIELIRQAIQDPKALKEAIFGALSQYNIPHEEVRKDIQKLIQVSQSLYESFGNIFFQTQQSATKMTQSA